MGKTYPETPLFMLREVRFRDEFASTDPQVTVRVRDLLARNRARATLLLGGIRFLVHEWRLDGYTWSLPERGGLLVSVLFCDKEER